MTTYFKDFGSESTGSAPSDFTHETTDGSSLSVETDAGAPSGQECQFTPASSQQYQVWSWDDIDGDANRDDAEALILWDLANSLVEDLRIAVRGNATGDAMNGYQAVLEGSQIELAKRTDGAGFTSLGTAAKSPASGEQWWVRLRANGTTISVKAWEDGTGEPGSWDVQVTDSDISGVGFVAVGRFGSTAQGANRQDIWQIGVGTNGDTAPDSAATGPAAATIAEGDVVDDITAEIDVTGAATGITEHELHRSTSSGFTPGASTRVMDSLPTTDASFTLSDGPADSLDPPDPDTTYYYVLRSIDSGGTTDSDEVEIQTAPPRPRLPKEGHNEVAESRMDADSDTDGVVDGFDTVETGVVSPANPFSLDATLGAQKVEATDTDSGGEASVGYFDIPVSGGEEWTAYVGCKFSGLTANMFGRITFIWRDSEDTATVVTGTDLFHTTFQRKSETFTAPNDAATLEVRLQVYWDELNQQGTAWWRDLQVIKSGDETGSSFTGTVLDETQGQYVTRFWIDEGLDGDWEIHAEVINDESVDGQNTETPFENLDPSADVAWKATTVDGSRQSGFSPTRTITRAVSIRGKGIVSTTVMGRGSITGVSLPPIRQKGPSDVLWYADWSQDRDAFVGGAPDYARGGTQYVRSHKAQGGPLWVPVGGDKIAWGRIAVDGVQAPSRGMVLQPATEIVVDDTADFDQSTSAWIRSGFSASEEADSAFAALPTDGEARRFTPDGSTLNPSLRQTAGTLTGDVETLSVVLERDGASTSSWSIFDQTAAAHVVRGTYDWTTETVSVAEGTGSDQSVYVAERVERGPNGKSLVRLVARASGTAGNTRRVFVYPCGHDTPGASETAIVHHVQHEARAYATDPVPGTGSVDTRPKAGCSYTAGPDGSTPFIGYTRFMPMGAPGDFDDFTRVWQVSDALNGTPRAFLRYNNGDLEFVLDAGSDTSVSTVSPTIAPGQLVEVFTAVENAAGDTLIGVRVDGGSVTTATAGGPSSGLTALSGSTIHLNETPQETAVGAHRYHRMAWLPVSALDTPISGHADRLMDELEHERQPAYGSAA